LSLGPSPNAEVRPLRKGAIDGYIPTCQTLGIDIVELSGRFVTSLTDDWLRLIETVQSLGLKMLASSSVAAIWEPEIGIQSGAGEPSAIAACGGRVVTCKGERRRDLKWQR
jgi:hypothetical protein